MVIKHRLMVLRAVRGVRARDPLRPLSAIPFGPSVMVGGIRAEVPRTDTDEQPCGVSDGVSPRTVTTIAHAVANDPNEPSDHDVESVMRFVPVAPVVMRDSSELDDVEVSNALPGIRDARGNVLSAREGGGLIALRGNSAVNTAPVSRWLPASGRTGGFAPRVAIADRGVGVAVALR